MSAGLFLHRSVAKSLRSSLDPNVLKQCYCSCFSTSAVNGKRDKYSLDFLPIQRKGGRGTNQKRKKGGTAALFTLERSLFWDYQDATTQTSKMAMIGYAIQSAVSDMLVSSSVPKELQRAPIDIVKVHMSPSLNVATISWRLDMTVENRELEENIGALLESNLSQLQMLLPVFHKMSSTPSINFKLYDADVKESEMEKLFLKVREDLETVEPETSDKQEENIVISSRE